MIHRNYFTIEEQEATEEELHDVVYTTISVLGFVITMLVLLTLYFII